MNKVMVININTRVLENYFHNKYILFNSAGLNFVSGLLSKSHFRYNVSEMTFTASRHCRSLSDYRFADKLHTLSYNNMFNINYSTLLRQCSNNPSILDSHKRFKSKKQQKRPEYDSDSDDDDDDDDYEGLSKATKPLTLRMQSLRVDGLLKKTLGLARNKVETYFYEGSIRVNGTKPTKKSYQVKMGDEVDLIKGVSPMNPEFLSISRVEVLSVKEDTDEGEDKLLVKVRRTKTMYIENYETDPWKKTSSAE